MSYRTITINEIHVIGTLWMGGTAAMTYKLTAYDLENIGELTRENVQKWLDTHSGDFQSLSDFHADIGDFDSPWEHAESECTFNDCMFPSEE